MKKSSYNIGYILFLAVVAACGGFLFGYDTAVISGTIKQVTTLFGLNDIEQGWYVGCALVGSIAGVAVAGTMSDWIGRRLTMIFASIMFSVSAIGCALCGSYQWLVFHHFVYYTGESALVVVAREGRPIGVYFREDLFSERTGEEAGRGVAGLYSQRDEIGIQIFVPTRNSYGCRCRIMYCDFGTVYGCKCCFVLRAYDI